MMKSIFIGLIILAAAVFAILPAEQCGFGLGWSDDVLVFLRGALPVIGILISLIAIFVGIADIKDRAEAKKEKAAKQEEA